MKLIASFIMGLSILIPIVVYIDWLYLTSKDPGAANMGFGVVYLFALFIHIILGVLWAVVVKHHLILYFLSLGLLVIVGVLINAGV